MISQFACILRFESSYQLQVLHRWPRADVQTTTSSAYSLCSTITCVQHRAKPLMNWDDIPSAEHTGAIAGSHEARTPLSLDATRTCRACELMGARPPSLRVFTPSRMGSARPASAQARPGVSRPCARSLDDARPPRAQAGCLDRRRDGRDYAQSRRPGPIGIRWPAGVRRRREEGHCARSRVGAAVGQRGALCVRVDGCGGRALTADALFRSPIEWPGLPGRSPRRDPTVARSPH